MKYTFKIARNNNKKARCNFLNRCKEFIAFKDEYGHGNVPQSIQLEKWVNKQRSRKDERDRKTGNHTPLQDFEMELLENIGFSWARKRGEWKESYQALLEFKKEYGHCNVPTTKSTLGRWVSSQRANYKNEKLEDEKIFLLANVGFKWKWSRHYDHYEELLS